MRELGRTQRARKVLSFKIAALLRCHASIVMKIIPQHFATLLKLPVKC